MLRRPIDADVLHGLSSGYTTRIAGPSNIIKDWKLVTGGSLRFHCGDMSATVIVTNIVCYPTAEDAGEHTVVARGSNEDGVVVITVRKV